MFEPRGEPSARCSRRPPGGPPWPSPRPSSSWWSAVGPWGPGDPGTRGPGAFAGAGGALVLAGLAVATEVGGSSLPVSPGALVWGSGLVYAGVLARWCQDHSLSAREREVLGLLVAGVPRNDVSGRLFISPVTVKNHLASLYRKTQTSDLGSLVAAARHAGWSGPDHRD